MSEFLAEAAVRIVPDTTAFRAELAAQIATATRSLPPVIIPVETAVAQQTAGISQAIGQAQGLANQQATMTKVTTETAKATGKLTDAQKLQNRAARLLAISEEEVLNVTSEQAAAQITATRSAAALTAARRAEAAVTAETDAALSAAITKTLGLAEAQNIAAQSALREAEAQAATGASLAFASRGAGATALSMLGLRGATLAANSAFLVGAGAIAGFAKSVQGFTAFSSELNVFKETAGASADEMVRVSAAAKALGRDVTLPGVSAQDAAEAMTELAKAGLSVNDSIAGARGVLQLATAAQLSNADATTLAASALNAFGLSGNKAVHVADLLANASNEAQGGIEDMGLALRQSAAVARQVGISLDDTVALLTLLARNGLQGSDAGTALRTSLIRLINPTKQAKEVLKELNVQLRDQQGNIRPEVFADFAKATDRMSKSQRDAKAAIVFGQDAIRAEAILGREGARGLDAMRVALEKQGTASRVANARMTGLAGSAANLSNQLDTLGLTVGKLATPLLSGLADIVATNVGQLNTLAEAATNVGSAFSSIPGASSGGGFLKDAAKGFLVDPIRFVSPITALGIAIRKASGDTGKEIDNAGADLRSGIEDASREAVKGAESLADRITNAIDDAFAAVNEALRKGRANARKAALEGVQGATGQQAGLEEAMSGILAAGGSPQQQIANLQRQAAVQAKIIERAGPDAAGVLLKARRAAREKLAEINQQIVSIQGDIAAQQKQAADDAAQKAKDAQDARDKADQNFIDGISGKLGKIDNKILAAQATKGLADDIRFNKQKRDALAKSIKQVRDTVQDAKARRNELQSLVREQITVSNTIKDLIGQQREAEQKAVEARRQAVTDTLAKRTQLAELRGDNQAELAALNAQIDDARKRVAAAKKAKKGVLDEQIALQSLINQRKELIDKITGQGADQGSSLADFLRQNTDLFNQIAPNLGKIGIDPLSGFDFSKSLTATLSKLQAASRGTLNEVTPSGLRPPGGVATDSSIQKLIAALDRNTEATRGNTGTGGAGLNKVADIAGQRGEAMARFWENRQARVQTSDTHGI